MLVSISPSPLKFRFQRWPNQEAASLDIHVTNDTRNTSGPCPYQRSQAAKPGLGDNTPQIMNSDRGHRVMPSPGWPTPSKDHSPNWV
ncbi:hypothetical protein ACFPRL_19315 [Pseudoclavibacter helvolus]